MKHLPPAASLLLGLGLPLMAHPATPPAPAYRVAAGDTLYRIAEREAGTSARWPDLQRLNRVPDPRRLQPGTTLLLPPGWGRTAPASAVVDEVQGAASVSGLHGRNDTQAQPLARGAVLPQGARLSVPEGGHVSVRLADGSVVRIQQQSDLTLQRLERKGAAGDVQSELKLERGRVDSSVQPQRRSGQRFEIHTPLAVASVRGTEFGVGIDEGGRTIASVTEGLVAIRAAGPEALLPAGQGLAVAAGGRIGAPRALLPAPDLAGLENQSAEPGLVAVQLPSQAGATGYLVRLAGDPELQRVVRNTRAGGPAVSFAGLSDGDYTLGVRVLDAEGIPGYEARRTIALKAPPTPPLYQRPAPGERVSSQSGELLCTAVPDAVSYRIQVARSEDFTAPLVDGADLPACRQSLKDLPAGDYYWRAATTAASGSGRRLSGPFAAPQRFTVVEPPEAQAVEARPVTGGTLLHWRAEPGQTYRLQVARDPAFGHLVRDERLAEAQSRLDGLAPGFYYVRLQVIDALGAQSAFSGAREVQVPALLLSGSGEPVQGADGGPVRRD